VHHLKTKKNRSFTASIALLFLFFSVIHAWAEVDDTVAPSPVAQAEEISVAGASASGTEEDDWLDEDSWNDEWEDEELIADPLEPLNRLFFHFNDKLYYWVLKPVARVYSGVFPEEMQIAVRNFFDNLRAPARAVNCLLQGRMRNSSQEVVRFALNSTAGILGFGDFARDVLGLDSSHEDTGQTLGYYGAGGWFYINWPFLGPSNFRDSIGMVGDAYLHPFIFLDVDWEVTAGAWVLEKVNYTALTLGDYELFTETALDPYAAVKDAYQQYRKGLIENK
jgi:phospholipid-binding lipoprotein MlaA